MQNLQDLALNALKMKLFLQGINIVPKNLAGKICKIIFLQDFDQTLQENYVTIFLARFLQEFLNLARKASFLMQGLQDMRKI